MNTTTIESSIGSSIGSNIFFQIFNVLGSIITGIALGVVVVSYMVYPIKSSNNDTQTTTTTDEQEDTSGVSDSGSYLESESKSESDSEEPVESDELVESDFDVEQRKKRELIIYNNKLFDELSQMDTRELSHSDLEELHSKVVEEETPYGKVIMTYNHISEAFWWHSPSPKSDSILYKTLDTVARVFAITHDCKQICINYKEEFLKDKKRVIELLENDAKVRKELGSGPEVKIDDPKYAITVNKKNRFINKELSDLHKKIEVRVPIINNTLDDGMTKMSYADFKKNYNDFINKVKEE